MKKIFTRILCLGLLLGMIADGKAAVVLPSKHHSNEPDPATVSSAVAYFRNLSKKEKKERVREVKKAVREYKALKKKKAAPVASTLLQVIFAILIPPLGVYLHEGEINNRFWIDLLLTLLFFLPGMIYALIIVLGD